MWITAFLNPVVHHSTMILISIAFRAVVKHTNLNSLHIKLDNLLVRCCHWITSLFIQSIIYTCNRFTCQLSRKFMVNDDGSDRSSRRTIHLSVIPSIWETYVSTHVCDNILLIPSSILWSLIYVSFTGLDWYNWDIHATIWIANLNEQMLHNNCSLTCHHQRKVRSICQSECVDCENGQARNQWCTWLANMCQHCQVPTLITSLNGAEVV